MKLPADLFEPPPWHAQAACRKPGVSPEWFFPDNKQDDRPAITVCFRCPVRLECLEEGMSVPTGIWGGVRATTRRRWKGTLEQLYEVSAAEADARRISRRIVA